MPKGVLAFPLNYWEGFTADEVTEFMTLKTGLHANEAETSAVLAINPNLVDMDRANAEMPNFPAWTVNPGAVHAAFFFSQPGSVYRATKSGTWGDARQLHARERRAIHRGRRALHDCVPREHRGDVQGDPAAGVGLSAMRSSDMLPA